MPGTNVSEILRPPAPFAAGSVSLQEHLERILDERMGQLTLLVNERDRQYAAQFQAAALAVQVGLVAQKTATDTALTAQKEATAAAFAASEKAIVKAEDAQREYNIRSNEFRGQLDDQNKMQIPRLEADNRFGALDEKIGQTALASDAKLQAAIESSSARIDTLSKQVTSNTMAQSQGLTTVAFDLRHNELQKQVNELRESRSQEQGRGTVADPELLRMAADVRALLASRDQGQGKTQQVAVSTQASQWLTGLLIGAGIAFAGLLISITNMLINAGAIK